MSDEPTHEELLEVEEASQDADSQYHDDMVAIGEVDQDQLQEWLEQDDPDTDGVEAPEGDWDADSSSGS